MCINKCLGVILSMKFQSLHTDTHTHTHTTHTHSKTHTTHTHTHPHTHTTHTHTNTHTHKLVHTQTNTFPCTVTTRSKQSVISFTFQQQFYKAVPSLRLLVAVLSRSRHGFISSPVCVGFMLNKAAVGLVCLQKVLF